MGVSSYTNADEIARMFRRVVETAGLTPDDIEFFVDIADSEINGSLAGRYTVPFSSGMFPIEPVRSIARLFTAHAMLRSQIWQEDPSRSDWVQQLRDQGERLLASVASGTADIIAWADNAASAQVVAPKTRAQDSVWSSTMQYKPTMDLREPIKQRIDPDRLDDMESADTGGRA